MPNAKTHISDEELKEARQQRNAVLLVLGVGCTIGIMLILYGEYKLKRAQASVEWPTAPGRIVGFAHQRRGADQLLVRNRVCLHGRGN
ncbi:MAG: DUF3592 domain-containing protein [Pirellulaceae bacterium]|nr:DUF3592 domain-containing protein [Pirellulaceae bacterium]